MVLVHSAKIAMTKAIINHRHCHHAGGQRHYQGKDQELEPNIWHITSQHMLGCPPCKKFGGVQSLKSLR
jgi:hypothetical protein